VENPKLALSDCMTDNSQDSHPVWRAILEKPVKLQWRIVFEDPPDPELEPPPSPATTSHGTDCKVLPFQPLPFCPEHWEFQSAGPISEITILGYARPQVRINWNGLLIKNTFTDQSLEPVQQMHISPWQAIKLRKLISGSYNVYPFLRHQGYAFHLGMGRSNAANQANDETSELHDSRFRENDNV